MKRSLAFAIDAILVVTFGVGAFAFASCAGASLGGAELCGTIGLAAGMAAAAIR